MNVDYLLIGYRRSGEIKRVDHEEGEILPTVITFEHANPGGPNHPEKNFEVLIKYHRGNRYAIAVALDGGEVLEASEINALIESSGMRPVPDEIIGEI
nr:hypothetical protein [uncultured Enterobacter sp.]